MRTETPIQYGMKHPARIRAEYDPIADLTWLHFDGADGSRLTVGLSKAERDVLAGLRAADPAAMARDLYIAGHIDVDELERRLTRFPTETKGPPDGA